MRVRPFVYVCGVAIALTSGAQTADAQTPDAQALRQEIEQLRREFQTLQKEYGDRLTALESKLSAVDGQIPAVPAAAQAQANQPAAEVPPGAAGAGGPSGSLPVYGGGAAGAKVFNPDIAVIGDVLGAIGRNTVNPSPALEMHEAEAAFQAIVDPYARADFFIAFGEEGAEIEEGYLTFPAIPGGLLVKAGKQRAAFGKVNTLHNHVLPWTDRPIVISNLLGGEEGISDAGISVARLVPNPWFFLEATGQVYRGDSGDLFQSSKRGDLAYVGRLRGYQDITENTNIDLGASYSRGHNASGVRRGVDLGRFVTDLWGVDATLRWRPLQRSIYHSFVGRSELIWSRREQPRATQRAFGYYVSGDYQFARRWFAGGRYDDSDRADDGSVRDRGGALVLTFWPSEFSQIRSEYRRIRFGDGEPVANELLFQFIFSIGAHGAHPF